MASAVRVISEPTVGVQENGKHEREQEPDHDVSGQAEQRDQNNEPDHERQHQGDQPLELARIIDEFLQRSRR